MEYAIETINPLVAHEQINNTTPVSPYIIAKYPFHSGRYIPRAFWEVIKPPTTRMPQKHSFFYASWIPGLRRWSEPKLITPAYSTISFMHINRDQTQTNEGLPFFSSITLFRSEKSEPTPLEEIIRFAQIPYIHFSDFQKALVLKALLKRYNSWDPEIRWFMENWHTAIEKHFGHPVDMPNYEGTT